MNVQKIRKLFPVTKRWIYMNHAAVAPLSTRVVAATNAFLRDQLENGVYNWKNWYETYAHARSLLARLINGHADEMAFVKNTSEGVSIVANGLRLGKGDRVVVAEPEFPSNIYPWMALEKRGVRLIWLREKNGRLPLEEIRKALRRRPRVLALSFVEFLSGFRNDLIEIGRMCEEFSVFFFVDAIQGLGAFPIDVQSSRIDALAADSKKWLLGPESAGFLYCSKKAISQLDVTEHGWMSVKNPGDYDAHKIVYPDGALRFEPGSLNTAGIHGLVAALELVLEIGIPAISDRILFLTNRLCDGLHRRGYRLLSPRGEGEGSGIVTFRHPKIEASDIVKGLLSNSVLCSERMGNIRLSPHYYLIEEEIDRVVTILP